MTEGGVGVAWDYIVSVPDPRTREEGLVHLHT